MLLCFIVIKNMNSQAQKAWATLEKTYSSGSKKDITCVSATKNYYCYTTSRDKNPVKAIFVSKNRYCGLNNLLAI